MVLTTEQKLLLSEAKVEALTSSLSEALVRIRELEALVSKLAVVKTSQNSSKPPSTDMARKNQSLREKSGKPVGGQKGHEGHTLKMTATPDVTIEERPAFCNQCGSSLAGADFKLVARRQVIDIPPIVPATTEYQSFGTVCKCGHHACGDFPQGVTNHVQYGENIQSMVVYQAYYQFTPFARLQDYFLKVCGLHIGKGTLENILRRTANKAKPAYNQIQKTIAVSFFVGADETSFKSNGDKHWFWVWQTVVVTYIVAAVTRSKQVIEDTFPGGLPNTILGSDRLAAQLSTITRGNQICLAHLLRELNYLIQAEGNMWAAQFKQLLKDAIALKQLQAAYAKDDPQAHQIERRADLLLAPEVLAGLQQDTIANKQTITFFNGMVKLRHALFPCLYHELVTFDNNASERAFRMVKVKGKISGQFKSLQSEFAIIRSVIDTAIKNGQPPFEAIRAAVQMPTPVAAG
jgi:transposase